MAGDLWFVGARAVAARSFLAALATVVLIVTAGVTTLTVFLADAAEAGIRSTIDTAPARARAVVLTTELGADRAAQSAAAARLFATAFAGVPIRVDAAVAGVQLAVDPVRSAASLAPVTVEPRVFVGLAGHARIVAGSWPGPTAGTGIAIAVPADPAAAAGWRVGDRATVAGDDSGTVLRVAALYRPFDPLDPYFLPQPGGPSATPLLAAVGERDLKALASSPSALWTISPDTSRLRPADALPLSRAVAELGQLAGNDAAVAVRGIRVSGGLPATLTTVLGSLDAARGVAVLPIVLTAGLGLLLVVVLLAALSRTRRQELAVLRGRGLSSARLTGFGAAEAMLVAVPAAVAGTGVSAWIRTWAQSWAGSARAGPVPWWPAVLVCAVVPAAAVGLGLLDSRSTTTTLRPRSAALGSIVPVVLLAAGAVTVWRFRTAGSAVVTDASGFHGLDPVAAPAPAVSLVALALLGTLLAAVAARAAAAAAGRRRGLTAALTAREMSRRWATFGAAVTVVGLTVAVGVLTAGYDGTQQSFARASALLTNSADVRVDLPGSFAAAGVEPAADRLSRAAGREVRQATAVLAAPVTIGSVVGDLVAVSPADLAGFLPAVRDGYDPAQVAERLASSSVGPRLPQGASAFTVRLSMTAAAVRPDPTDPSAVVPGADAAIGVRPVVWVATAAGVQAVQGDELRVPVARAATVPVPATSQVTIPLPADLLGTAATVVAVDTVLDTAGLDTVDTVRIDGIAGGAATPGAAPVSWMVAALPDDRTSAVSAVQDAGRALGWDGKIPAAAGERTVRLLPVAGSSDGGVAQAGAPVRMVVNQLMADQVGATVGGALELRLGSTAAHVLGTVVAISPVLPGEEDRPRAVADRTAVAAQLLATTTVVPDANQVWISTAAPEEVAARLRGQAGPGWVVGVAGQRSAAALIDPARTALWLGVALFLLLAVIALGLLVGMLGRDRRGEIRPLMASGLTRRQWVALRRWELWWCLVIGALLGLAVGVGSSLLTVGGLARSAVVGAPEHLDPVLGFSTGLWPALAAAAVGALVVLGGSGRLAAASWGRAVR